VNSSKVDTGLKFLDKKRLFFSILKIITLMQRLNY